MRLKFTLKIKFHCLLGAPLVHSNKKHYRNVFLSSVTHAQTHPWDQSSAFLGKVNTFSPNLATFL